MLRVNLSTRPFYNDKLVSAGLVVVAVIVLALTAFNVKQVLSLSQQRTELHARVSADADMAARISANAVALQRSLDRNALARLAGETREANLLIDQRTFSWTVFFNLIEKTQPLDVRLVSVAPEIDKNGTITVSMIVEAKRSDDLDKFMQALEETGAFYGMLPRTETRSDDGMHRASIRGNYLPPKLPPSTGKGRP